MWIDGGFGVDALIGRETREHSDLDLAVERQDASRLRQLLESLGMAEVPRGGSCEWMYVLADERRQVDVHVFEYDIAGKNICGVEYPLGSLTGHGVLGGILVNCVAPQWMFKFKTAYEPAAKDLADIRELAKAFGYRIPDSHVQSTADFR